MSKKDKKKNQENLQKNMMDKRPTISKRGWKVIGIGVGIVLLGFIVLSLTDARAENWAGHISPFLIIGGYATIGVGIMTNDPTDL